MSFEYTEPMASSPPAPIRHTAIRVGQLTDWDAAIVIPAKNEEYRILECLDAAARAILLAKHSTIGVVLIVNNTSDCTASRALNWATVQNFLPFVLADCDFSPAEASVGAARRLGLDTACNHLAPHGALLTTDADSAVHDDWVVRNLSELSNADLICGTVRCRPEEVRALPCATRAHGCTETDYLKASMQLVAKLDPQLHDLAPAHHNAAGASMAVSRKVYEAVGGLPVLRLSEDRAFHARVEACDFRVRFSPRVIVETSCRMTGRTDGGMAGALRARAVERDPLADEWIESPDALEFRYRLRGRLRSIWPEAAALHSALSECLGQHIADRIMARPIGPHFGAFFASLERQTPQLARHRLRMSDCRKELPRLRNLLATFENEPEIASLRTVRRLRQHSAV